VHPVLEERFAVLAGELWIRRGLRTMTARAGDAVTVAPGTVHRFANRSGQPVHVRVQVRPAIRMEQLLETAAALAAEGRTLLNGLPRPLDFALFLREFECEVRAPLVPWRLVRLATAPLALAARHLELDRRYRPAAVGARGRRYGPAAA
jgi:Cupin domain